jgi:hypothetical protein
MIFARFSHEARLAESAGRQKRFSKQGLRHMPWNSDEGHNGAGETREIRVFAFLRKKSGQTATFK